jgi:hypothetical protein
MNSPESVFRCLSAVVMPFENLTEAFIAIYVTTRINNKNRNSNSYNLKLINFIIKKHIQISNFEFFLERCGLYKSVLPIEFFNSFKDIEQRILDYEDHIVTFRPINTNCLICNESLKYAEYHEQVARLYSYSQKSKNCCLVSFKCKKCKSKHFFSYVLLINGVKKFQENSLNEVFIHFTDESVYEILLLRSVTTELVHKHASFTSICSNYNSLMNNNANETRGLLVDKRLSESWFYFNLCCFYNEYYGDLKKFDGPTVENLDIDIKKARQHLFPYFVKKWTGDYHRNKCTHSNCTLAINIDGNHKCNRLTCMYDNYIYQSPEINGKFSLKFQ